MLICHVSIISESHIYFHFKSKSSTFNYFLECKCKKIIFTYLQEFCSTQKYFLLQKHYRRNWYIECCCLLPVEHNKKWPVSLWCRVFLSLFFKNIHFLVNGLQCGVHLINKMVRISKSIYSFWNAILELILLDCSF